MLNKLPSNFQLCGYILELLCDDENYKNNRTYIRQVSLERRENRDREKFLNSLGWSRGLGKAWSEIGKLGKGRRGMVMKNLWRKNFVRWLFRNQKWLWDHRLNSLLETSQFQRLRERLSRASICNAVATCHM